MSAQPPPSDERWRGALALSVVGCVVTCLAVWQPESGWNMGDVAFKISLPSSWAALLEKEEVTPVIPRWKPEDVSELLARYDEEWSAASADLEAGSAAEVAPDSIGTVPVSPPVVDSAVTSQGKPGPESLSAPSPAPARRTRRAVDLTIPDPASLPPALRITIPESARSGFQRLFAQLDLDGEINVLHYGDSQIEGDRISGVMRNAWQKRWGGYGPGLQPAVPLVQSFALRQGHTGPWKRHTRYGRRDTTDVDERYGLLACYAALDLDDSEDAAGCLTVAPEPRNHKQFSRWDGIRLWHDSLHSDCIVRLNDLPVDTLVAGTGPGTLVLSTPWPDTLEPAASEEARICFEGPAPRIFAVEPVGAGVQWHGVSMRGSSGTLFRKLDRSLLLSQWDALDPELVILQYGGNMVPHCKDSLTAERYGGWFASQIRLFHRVLPNAAILVIGPSDMAEKTGVDWTSYRMLDPVRKALREAALNEGAAYWDLLEVMGGLGSMPAWVESDPPLAGPDHVHFTPLGAKRVGTLLDRSFLACYGEWKRNWAAPAPSALPKRSPDPVTVSVAVPTAIELHD